MQPLDSEGDSSLRVSWSTALDDVLDERAELRDVIVQMPETADLGVFCGLLEPLHALLQTHFEREEREEGVLRLTHTRTGFAEFDLTHVPDVDPKLLEGLGSQVIRVPVNHAKIFGWYDNEYGSYTNMMGDLTVHIHRTLD
jgi:hypothetical protein